MIKKKSKYRDFPSGSLVKNPPANARDMGLIDRWSEKIPHAMEQRSLCTTTTEAHPDYSLCSTTRKAIGMRGKRTTGVAPARHN